MSDDLLYQIALSQVPNIGDVHARILLSHFGSARSVFAASKKSLAKIEGLGTVRIQAIKPFDDFKGCEDELRFIEKYDITPLALTDKRYPRRLLHCYDAPPLLYFRGNADLNTTKIISVVGTRNSSDYGKHVCEILVDGLKEQQVMIVSGLAFGIDTIAHKTALKHTLKTVGVLAHGLDRLYPPQNKMLAKMMCEEGDLLTEFKSKTNPDRENFPRRNRIVAGICDCIIVIESGAKGGSLITADLSNGYNRDVFAVPGKINDAKSEGCNQLIKNNKANMVTCAQDILDLMNWNDEKRLPGKRQRALFIELTEHEQMVLDIIVRVASVGIDDIYLQSKLSSSTIAAALLSLEMEGLISSSPGKMYKAL